MERGCQVVELVRYFLQVNGPMRRLYLADRLPGLRRSPDSRSYTIVLLQRFLFDCSCPLDVERHAVFRIWKVGMSGWYNLMGPSARVELLSVKFQIVLWAAQRRR